MDLTNELLFTAHGVLTGRVKRAQLTELSDCHMAYAATTMVLAMRYKIDANNELTERMDSVISDVALRGDLICQFETEIISSNTIRKIAGSLGLYRNGTLMHDGRFFTLTPSSELVALIKEYRHHPAISAFRADMEKGIAAHEAWLRTVFEEAEEWTQKKAVQQLNA